MINDAPQEGLRHSHIRPVGDLFESGSDSCCPKKQINPLLCSPTAEGRTGTWPLVGGAVTEPPSWRAEPVHKEGDAWPTSIRSWRSADCISEGTNFSGTLLLKDLFLHELRAVADRMREPANSGKGRRQRQAPNFLYCLNSMGPPEKAQCPKIKEKILLPPGK